MIVSSLNFSYKVNQELIFKGIEKFGNFATKQLGKVLNLLSNLKSGGIAVFKQCLKISLQIIEYGVKLTKKGLITAGFSVMMFGSTAMGATITHGMAASAPDADRQVISVDQFKAAATQAVLDAGGKLKEAQTTIKVPGEPLVTLDTNPAFGAFQLAETLVDTYPEDGLTMEETMKRIQGWTEGSKKQFLENLNTIEGADENTKKAMANLYDNLKQSLESNTSVIERSYTVDGEEGALPGATITDLTQTVSFPTSGPK